MMFQSWFRQLVACAFCCLLGLGAAYAEPLKIGLIVPLTGPFAAYGQKVEQGMRLYLAEHGDQMAGRELQILVKDDTGISPAVAKRLAQELLARDRVDMLAGFMLTPNAFAVAPLATQAGVPMLVLNAATSSITEKSPNILRVSMTLPQNTAPLAQWARAQGLRTVHTLVADYGPGHDAEAQFRRTFTELGGEVVGTLRTPVSTPDYGPYIQRIKDAAPDAAFFFVPNGEQAVSLIKMARERGLPEAGIQLLATGDVTDEDMLDALGEASLGLITSFHYSAVHDSPENHAFVQAYQAAHPGERVNFMVVAGYDGMRLIHEALEKTGGDASAAAFVAAARDLAWISPRGPVRIDPETRDIVQNVYMRRVDRVDGLLQNVEFDVIEAVPDPVKAGR
ncbi:ABC transporter substrate-binding protein [Castellaniella sp.]|uniref:ABC transporter substrate-binding protein n=1 Tax=Castellaniella sp. TaxID=1955812 RepID=UPI00355ECD05